MTSNDTNETQVNLCKKEEGESQLMYISVRVINYTFSIISLIGLCYYMFRVRISPMNKSSSGLWVKTLIISELTVCILHLLNIIKDFSYTYTSDNVNNKMQYLVIHYIQIFFGILSDLITITVSFLFAIKAYLTIEKQGKIFNNPSYHKAINKLLFIVPILISIVVFIVNWKLVKTVDIADDECKTWSWVQSEVSIALYCIFWLLLIVSAGFSCKTIQILKKFEKNNVNCDMSEEDSDNDDSFIKKIHKVKAEIMKYPLVSLYLWFFLSIDRVVDDGINIYIREVKNEYKKEIYTGFVLDLKYFLIILVNVAAGIRGLLYVMAFVLKEGCRFPKYKMIEKQKMPLLSENETGM